MPDSSSSPSAASSAADLSGRQLGDYRLLRRLGRGGMADVYLAEQCALRRQVAFKVLKSDLAADESYVKRFHQEAQAAASLVHANIVQIHEVGCIDGIRFIAQEYVRGQNLREHLARFGPPDIRQSLAIMRQVAAALQRAAERGIVHRDIKPENILLAESGEAKVADFGLARASHAPDGVGLTQVGMTMGTPLYMSPEQVEGKPLDPRSDIYSFGVTCYHMLAGNPPFQGETALGVAVQHLHAQPQRLEDLRPDLPDAVARIVHRMLAKDPTSRYSDARELIAELRAVRVPGQEDEWPGEFECEPSPDLPGTTAGRFEATRRLAAVMKPAPPAHSRYKRAAAWGVAALAAFGLGALLAWSNREPWLLADADSGVTRVEPRPTPQAQLAWAKTTGTETAFLSVIEHFPDKPFFVHSAEKELAWLYLLRDDRLRALELFDKLAALPESDMEFRAYGLAGQCVVLSLEDQHQRSAEKLDALIPVRDKLEPRMRQLVVSAARENRRALNLRDPDQWSNWIEERFGE